MQFTSILAEHLHNIIVEWKPSLLLQPLQGDYFKSDTKLSSALRLSHLAFRYLCLWCGLHSFRLAQSRVGRTSSKLIVLCLLCHHWGGRTVTAKCVPFLPESEAPHCRRSIERKLDSRLAFFHHRRSQFWTCRSVCFQVGLDQRNGGKWFNTHTHTLWQGQASLHVVPSERECLPINIQNHFSADHAEVDLRQLIRKHV